MLLVWLCACIKSGILIKIYHGNWLQTTGYKKWPANVLDRRILDTDMKILFQYIPKTTKSFGLKNVTLPRILDKLHQRQDGNL